MSAHYPKQWIYLVSLLPTSVTKVPLNGLMIIRIIMELSIRDGREEGDGTKF